jgi:hypothetical protein
MPCASRLRNRTGEVLEILMDRKDAAGQNLGTAEHATQSQHRKWRRVTLLARLLLTFVVVGALVRLVGWIELRDALLSAEWLWLAAMYGFSLGTSLVGAFQLHLVLRLAGSRVQVGRVFLANASSVLYGLALPGDVVASFAKWADLSAATGQRARVLNAIIYSRFAMVLVPLAVGVLALLWENPFAARKLAPLAAVTVLCVSGVAFLLFHPLLGRHLDRFILARARGLGRRFELRVQSVVRSLQDPRDFRFVDHAFVGAVATLWLLLGLCILFTAIQAMNLDVPLLALAWTWAVVNASRQLPLTISNLGVREGLLILCLGAYGVDGAEAIVVGLLLFSGTLLMAGVGAAYQLAVALRPAD